MKTISGSILASKSITLSKAASSMNSFLSMETGATIAVSSYLQRCASAFNELVQDHKELKTGRRSERRKHKHKENKSRLETLENANTTEENHKENNNLDVVERKTDLGEEEEEESVRYPENSGLGSIDEEEKTMEMKKTKKSDQIEREHAGIEVEEIKEKKKKKRKKPLDDSEERHTMMKKKRKHEREET